MTAGPGADESPSEGPRPERTSLRQTARLVPTVLKREAKKKSGTTPFLIWISFLISFAVSRIWVLAFRSVGGGKGKEEVIFSIGRNIILGGYHVHHIAVGVFLLAIAGWAALHWRGRHIARISAVMYGVGLGFIVDELGFIIGNIQPYRGDEEVFYLAVAIGAFLMSVVYFPSFWRSLRHDMRGVARLITSLPSLQDPKRKVTRREIDADVEEALGPAAPTDRDVERGELRKEAPPPPLEGTAAATDPQARPADMGPPTTASTGPPGADAAPAERHPVALAEATDVEPFDKQALLGRLLSRVIDVMILIIFAGLLLGLAKLILSLGSVFIGLSVVAMMQPIIVGILTLLVGVELFRAMLEYVRSGRIMLPFLVDAGILLGLRELATELYRGSPDPVLVAVIGGTLVALGGLRVFLVKTMLPPQTDRPTQGPGLGKWR